MDAEEQIKTLEAEFQETKEELKHILLDIRAWIMEAQSPIPNDLEREAFQSFYTENESEKREALRAKVKEANQEDSEDESDSEKGVEPDGKR